MGQQFERVQDDQTVHKNQIDSVQNQFEKLKEESSGWRKKYEDLAQKFEFNLKDWERQSEGWRTKYQDLLEESSKDVDTLRAQIESSKLEAAQLRMELSSKIESFNDKEESFL